ncbi:MAG: hypothetical protein ACYDCL_06385 [Myxococcales bacterium]
MLRSLAVVVLLSLWGACANPIKVGSLGTSGGSWGTSGSGSSTGGASEGSSGSSTGASGASSGTTGTASAGGSSSAGQPCSDDAQCPSGGYCDYGVASCDGGGFSQPPGLNTIVPGTCEIPTTDQGSCSEDAECPSDEPCVGGKCARCPVDAGPPPCFGVNASLCPPHCLAVPVPHVCYAAVCVCSGFGCAPPPSCSVAADCGGSDSAHVYACCDGGCFDISGDSANCGGCGTACPSGTFCTQNGSLPGVCEAPGASRPECPAACAADAGGLCCLGNNSELVCANPGESCPACTF